MTTATETKMTNVVMMVYLTMDEGVFIDRRYHIWYNKEDDLYSLLKCLL